MERLIDESLEKSVGLYLFTLCTSVIINTEPKILAGGNYLLCMFCVNIDDFLHFLVAAHEDSRSIMDVLRHNVH